MAPISARLSDQNGVQTWQTLSEINKLAWNIEDQRGNITEFQHNNKKNNQSLSHHSDCVQRKSSRSAILAIRFGAHREMAARCVLVEILIVITWQKSIKR